MEKKKIKLKYRMLGVYLLIMIPALVLTWTLTTNHIYNLIPISFVVVGVLRILLSEEL